MSSSPISLPKGGGSVSGLGETFSPDLFTGTGNFSVPIALPPGRNGFQPELGLQYSTGSGNSPFGLGWNLSVPGVMRKTAKGIPQYDDEKDTFILSGAEDLIAVKKLNIKFVVNGNNTLTNNEAGIAPLQGENGIITQYRPRTEGLFARIYHLKTNLRNCWKVMSKNGLTSWYGSKFAFAGDLSLVQKPDYATSIFAWKLTLTEDTFGSPIIYTYEKEQHRENEYHIWDQNYLKEIKYADYPSPLTPGGGTEFMVRVLFNYETREDAYSDYKSGFDIRTTQRCKNIQIFTNPVFALPPSGEILTRTYHFQYSDEVLPAAQLPYNGVSLLCKVEVEGHSPSPTLPNGEGESEFLPPLEFRYTQFKPKQQKFKQLKGKAMPLSSLANPGFELIDLFGNAMPDIVEINGVVRYWRNMGNGNFDEPRIMKNAPTGVTLGDPDVQLLDANGDGRTDLMVNGKNLSGYFSVKYDGSWDTKSFKKYEYAPSFSFADPEVKLLDLTGDGITDVLRNGNAFECFFQDKDKGWNSTKLVQKKQLAGFPNVSFADPRIKLADMSGDGMQDIVLINSGSIKYWPNLGYGNFGKPIVMKNAPRLPQSYDPARLQLSDIDGDGQADLIFVDSNKITFWINQSGNGWSEPFEIAGTPFVTNINGVRIADIYGSGVSGVLYSFDAYAETQRNRWFFLDLTGGTKPYLLHEMDNNMGALTRVSYQSSTRYYLKDQYGLPDAVLDAVVSANETPAEAALWKPNYAKRKPWKTTLPFPVQVVSRVDVIDELSKGKLSTRYLYHHGYWDGGEREFRGFGRVDQQDTETFERYNAPSNSPEGGGQDPSFNSSFVSYDGHELQFDQVGFEFYSPPTETRNWFHLGPVGDEFGEWFALDFSDEYWSGDPSVLQQELDTFQLLQNLPRRAKRDALRAWRGSSLRSELYALDAQENGEYVAGANGRPFTVSESQYGLRLEAAPTPSNSPQGGGLNTPIPTPNPLGTNVLYIPKETSGYVFFSFATSSRTTQWERGSDPMAQFSFTADYDPYGQARKQLSAALPRGIQPPYTNGIGTSPADEGNKILSTISVTSYAQKSNEETYIVDRSCKAVNYEVIQQNNENVFALKGRVLAATLPNEIGNVLFPIIGFTVNYYDAPDEFGAGLPLGTLGKYGALARTETLVLTDDIIQDAYGTTPLFFQDPNSLPPAKSVFLAAGYPEEFYDGLQPTPSGDPRLGYKRHDHSTEPNYATGWYAESGRTKYDWQNGLNPNPKGLVLETKDVFGALSSIEYDNYLLLPVTAKQWLSPTEFLATNAEYDYRVLQAKKVTDPNGNRTVFGFSPLGLLQQTGVIGKFGADEGDIITESPFAYKPSVLMEYNFFAFINNANPVWVKTIQREQHYQDNHNSPEIIKVEYTDGFGRLLQTRTQAEDVIFGDPLFGDSGLPETQGQNGNAVGIQRGFGTPLNVVVSGWKIYNNKGKVVEQYEPYFDKGFDYPNPALSGTFSPIGQKIKMYYDPRENVIRTVNPDKSEQWVVYGKPNTLSSIEVQNSWSFKNYTPSAWETCTYDSDDLAPITTGGSYGHDFTPKSATMDVLGRIVKTIDRLSQSGGDDVVMKYQYDIRGNLLKVTDALNRVVFTYTYDLRPQPKKEESEEEQKLPPIRTWHIDSGSQRNIPDATGKAVELNDAKGAKVLNGYDTISRPENVWAKDKTGEATTLRQHLIYGDSAGLPSPEDHNYLGKLYQQYDEAGLQQINHYDFKGNITDKFRKVISDATLLSVFGGSTVDCYRVNWQGLNTSILDPHEHQTNSAYDALNRITEIIYPEDVSNNRKTLTPVYNNAGALESVSLDSDVYVNHIAYNAKGQRILIAFGNSIMTRYAYDKKTFRLKRQRTETYNQTGWTFASAGNVKQDTAYQYDLIGNILATNEATTGSGIGGLNNLLRQFTYDDLYRLLSANGRENAPFITPIWDDSYRSTNNNDTTAYIENYQYDKMGNILQLQHVGVGSANNYTRNFTYNTATNNQLQSVDIGMTNYAFTYDPNGNQLTETSNRKFEWDEADRMRSFYVEASGSITKYTQYLYDASGNRVKKLTWVQSGNYDSSTYIDGIFEYRTDGTDEQNTLHVMDDKSRIATIRIGDDFGDITPAIKYNIEDHLGSSTIQLETNGANINKEEYYPFGETSFGSYAKKRYKYCGKERDDESGLYYYGARYYNAWTCRFVSIDPLANQNENNSGYCYANNNSIVYNDPTGMDGENQTSGSDNMDCGTEITTSHSKTTTENGVTTFSAVDVTYSEKDGVANIQISMVQASYSSDTGEMISMSREEKAIDSPPVGRSVELGSMSQGLMVAKTWAKDLKIRNENYIKPYAKDYAIWEANRTPQNAEVAARNRFSNLVKTRDMLSEMGRKASDAEKTVVQAERQMIRAIETNTLKPTRPGLSLLAKAAPAVKFLGIVGLAAGIFLAGKRFVNSGYSTQVALEETAGFALSMYMGTKFALAGAAFGLPGMVVGGLVGGMIGYAIGTGTVKKAFDFFNNGK